MPHRYQLNSKQLAELASLDYCRNGFSLRQVQKGGAVNTSYSLTTPSNRFFMKTFESDQVNQLARQHLFDVQKKIWQKGMACEPVYLSTTAGFQLDAWVECHTLVDSKMDNESKARTLANTLYTIHGLRITDHVLDLPAQWAGYLAQLPQEQYSAERKEAKKLASSWYATPEDELVFCHNDLSFEHVTTNTPQLIFDWEYCALSNRYFDLAACIDVNKLMPQEHACLLSSYAQHAKLPLSLVMEKTTQMLPLVSLTSRLWYAVANQLATSQSASGDKLSG
ncbi:choline/ethanolamine kinase family protein [Paraglaciecola chathamensis]|uniref:choline/ethanolamine kinase family protein n=1 Tax=Paraglaciecola chathamensis TaxID=368405 RepID=UPI0027031428|nr:choline/ethanolamine kinase family protein [Paraglaciecola chathamensis]MDO6842120.1 choline/ethanolamine kinase family protein [Paraglaciecola chathamensis]